MDKKEFAVMCCWPGELPVVYKDNLSYEAAHRLRRRLEKQKMTWHTYYVVKK